MVDRYRISREEEEQETTKRNNKRNKGILISVALAAIIITTSTFIKSSPHNINGTIDDVIEDNKETTLFDDVLELDETVGVVNVDTGEVEQIQLEDAIRMLENKAGTVSYLRELRIGSSSVNEIPEELKQPTLDYYNENGVEAIASLYFDDETNNIEKARIAQQLLFIEEYENNWLRENGISLSNSILTRVISSGAIQAYGTFEPQDYYVCEFEYGKRETIKEIILNDPISGTNDKLFLFPVFADEYHKAYTELQLINSKKEFTDDEILNMVEDTLNVTKRCINKELVKGKVLTYTKDTPNPESE